jgi:hypothetical protein
MPKEEAKRIEIGDLAEQVTLGVQRALEASKASPNKPFPHPRIICGIILEPSAVVPAIRPE